MRSRTDSFESLWRVFDARARSLTILLKIQARETTSTDEMDGATLAVEQCREVLGDTEVSRQYADYGSILRVSCYLHRWATAVRNAETESERYLDAAKQRARDYIREVESGDRGGTYVETARSVLNIDSVDSIDRVTSEITTTPLLVPIDAQRRFTRPTREDADVEEPRDVVAVAEFELGGASVKDPQRLEPNKAYDLKAQFSLSDWPDDAETVRFEPLHVEPAGRIAAPSFEFTRPDGFPPFQLESIKPLSVAVRQEIQARPLRLAYGGVWVGPSAAKLVVRGHKELTIHSFDPRLDPVTGFPLADEALVGVRDSIRKGGIVRDDELSNFLVVMTALANIAGQALSTNLFPGIWSEKEFQAKVGELLRLSPQIGTELEAHPHVGGGITDLSFRRVRVELKVENERTIGVEHAEAYFDQTKQYAVGSDSRLAVLCILNGAAHEGAPDSLDNDISTANLSRSANAAPTTVGIVLMRGNLSRPSDYSRKR